MRRILAVILLLVVLFFLPAYSFAQGIDPNLWVKSVINSIINFLWPIVVGIIVVVFLWIGVVFLTARGDPSKISDARGHLVKGIIGVIVIILSFSILLVIKATIGF